jgi:lysozyme
MRCNETGLALIRTFEGYSATPYRCPAGVWTIGHGHTHGVTKDSPPVTEEIAERLLIQDVEVVEKDMKRLITRRLDDNQWSACVSWVFNIGAAKIRGTRTLTLLNGGHLMDFANALLLWDKAAGKVLPGLTRRRHAERALFIQPILVAGKDLA